MLRQKRKRNLNGNDVSLEINNVVLNKSKIHASKLLKTDDYSTTTDTLEDFLFGSTAYDVAQNDPTSLSDEQDICGHESGKDKALWSDDDDDDSGNMSDSNLVSEVNCSTTNKETRSSEFTKIMGPTPLWAKSSGDSQPGKEDFLASNLLQVTTKALPKNDIDYTSCSLLNAKCYSSRKVESCEFHQTATIALTASHDCKLNLFQVDGKNNSKLHSLFLEQFPINCAHFLSNGTEVLMSSHVRWMYSYDMVSGTVSRVPFIKGVKDEKILKFVVSPDQQHIVFLSRYGKAHIVDSKTKELISTLKMNGSVEDVAFMDDGDTMLSFGSDAKVYVWDMKRRTCINTFEDRGCVKGTSISASSDNKLIACGSASGIVNVYGSEKLKHSGVELDLLKSYKNLRTPISTLEFNSTSEILAMSSDSMQAAVRLAHVPSHSVFSNFPAFKDKNMQYPRQVHFSPNSGFMAIGNSSGRVYLYRLNHYERY